MNKKEILTGIGLMVGGLFCGLLTKNEIIIDIKADSKKQEKKENK